MVDNSLDSKRIAKNTLVLYIRMFVLMIVNLYISRVVLHVLGENDYGIYNVVAGVVAMFSILSQSLSTAVSRFITFELGKGNIERLKTIFSSSVVIQVAMAVFVAILAEFLAVWFLNNRMNIPPERLGAANFVLQSAIALFALNLINVPFNACIIAHEKMSTFAYMSILEAALKLLIAFSISVSPYDKLKTYALFLLLADVIVKSVYIIYSRLKFEECKFVFRFDSSLLKEIGSFAGWNLLGNGVWILSTQGVNVLTNMFFPVRVNAARGITAQVDSAVNHFVGNFSTALNPQITKSYAMGNLEYMHSLLVRGAKYSFFLMWLFALPICLETETILDLWLHKVPEYAVDFVRLSFVGSLCIVLGDTLVKSMLATGKIKRYQIIVSIFVVFDFPLTYLAYKIGCPPQIAYVIFIVVYFLLIFVRLYLVKDLINFKPVLFFKKVLLKVGVVSVISSVLPLILIFTQEQSLLRLFETLVLTTISVLASVYFLGMEKGEKDYIVSFVSKKLNFKKK